MPKKILLGPLADKDKHDSAKVEAHARKLRELTDAALATAQARADEMTARRLDRMVSDGQLTEAEAAKHRESAA